MLGKPPRTPLTGTYARTLTQTWFHLVIGVTSLPWLFRLCLPWRHCPSGCSGWLCGQMGLLLAIPIPVVSLSKFHGNFPYCVGPFFGQGYKETIIACRKAGEWGKHKHFSHYIFSSLLMKIHLLKHNWHIYLVSDTMTVKTQIVI